MGGALCTQVVDVTVNTGHFPDLDGLQALAELGCRRIMESCRGRLSADVSPIAELRRSVQWHDLSCVQMELAIYGAPPLSQC